MLKKERQIYILDKVKKEGRAITNDLVEELGVAQDTIRKDFQELSANGLVRRIHGGVLKLDEDDVTNGISDFNERITLNPSIKKELARKAVELISGKKVIYIDGGTTNLKFAESLPKELQATVITNSPIIALTLCEHPYIRINLIGGKLDHTTKVIQGTNAIKQIQEMNIESCILGVSSLSPEHGITYPSFEESVLKKELLNHSKEIIVMVDKEKLGSIAAFYVSDISEIDYLITDETDSNILEEYIQNGIHVLPFNTNS